MYCLIYKGVKDTSITAHAKVFSGVWMKNVTIL